MRKVSLAVAALVLVALPAVAKKKDKEEAGRGRCDGGRQGRPGGLRYSVTVTKFENKAGWSGQWDLGDAWGTVFTDILNQTGQFIVLGEKDMREEAMDEQDLAASGRTAGGAKAPVTGQMTPAQLLVKGAITHVQESTTGGGGGFGVKGVGVGGGEGRGRDQRHHLHRRLDHRPGARLEERRRQGRPAGRRARLLRLATSGGDFGAFKKDNVGKAVEAACAEAAEFLDRAAAQDPVDGLGGHDQGGQGLREPRLARGRHVRSGLRGRHRRDRARPGHRRGARPGA